MTRRSLAETWLSYQKILPADAGEIQITETRRAFYAGATALWSLIMSTLDPGLDPTDAELKRMDALDAELTAFQQAVRDGRA
jgi:hypothetical protein